MDRFTITKRISKHGKNAIIHIPKDLQGQLTPKTLVEVNIKILARPDQNDS